MFAAGALHLFTTTVMVVSVVALSTRNTYNLLTETSEVPFAVRDFQAKMLPNVRHAFPNINPAEINQTLIDSTTRESVNAAMKKIAAQKNDEIKFRAFDTMDNVTQGFGPHLITSTKAIALADFADLMVETAKESTTSLRAQGSEVQHLLNRMGYGFLNQVNRSCPFTNPQCNSRSKYRTIDGSCNNLESPLWGRASTPYERFLPPAYGDGVNSPRTKGLFRLPLPSARNVSLEVHTDLDVKSRKLSHLAMEFGQFVSHDIVRNAIAKGHDGRNLNCCRFKWRRNCFPIPIADNDEFFDRSCMNFVRSFPTPPLDCRLGVRQQLNQNTHFLDGSAIYGSDQETLDLVRNEDLPAFLKSQGDNDLLPLDRDAICAPASRDKCFRAGDVRVNQQPALISLHTAWMRHHNNVAREIKSCNRDMSDETVFQETRKIVSAQLQHITYNEWLQEILGDDVMNEFDLKPKPAGQYYTGYNRDVKPMLRNAFSAAAFRFGHSLIGNDITEKKSSGKVLHHRLHTTFLKPELAYNGGVNSIMTGMYSSPAIKVDNYVTQEVTRHLFQTAPKNGLDLAAINIQRGRDHGLFDYNIWRTVCGLGFAPDFNRLNYHSRKMRTLLKKVYDSVFDIDLFTGGVSEKNTPGGNIGRTFACLIGMQFQALKQGDRFFYESKTNVKFPLRLLNEIKKTTMANILCETTGVTSIPRNVFRKQSASNRPIKCSSLPSLSFGTLVDGQ